MEQDEKVRENRLRRAAHRQRLRLVKSRRRDPRAYDFGGYMLVDQDTGAVAAGTEHGLAFTLSLDTVEEWLNTPMGEG
jgi:hypothetical protein